MSTPIKISKMNTAMMDDIVEVLKENLGAEIEQVCMDLFIDRDDYYLSVPEQYIRASVDLQKAFRRLNIDSCACWVTREGSTSLNSRFSQDRDQYNEVREQVIRISIVTRGFDGMEAIEFNGRSLLEEEVMEKRAEIYNAAVINVMTKYSEGASNNGIWQTYLETSIIDNEEVEGFGMVGIGSSTFRCLTDVLLENKQ